ncbi:MAG: hypothetical protein HYY24_09805 [Verrucomicrobia bacterium]|nr:hypothetical protein [Verrucomicrobiota bacterium]
MNRKTLFSILAVVGAGVTASLLLRPPGTPTAGAQPAASVDPEALYSASLDNRFLPVGPVAGNDPATDEFRGILGATDTATTPLQRNEKDSLLRRRVLDAQAQALEELLARHPDSPWEPSARAYLGTYYGSRAAYGKALEHLGTAWAATRVFQAGRGKEIADSVLIAYTHILAMLGQTDELGALIREQQNRELDGEGLSQAWRQMKEKYLRLLAKPEKWYKCGVFAVDEVAQALKLDYARGQ